MEQETLSSGKRLITSLSRLERLQLYNAITENLNAEQLCDRFNIDLSDFEHTFSRILKHLSRPTVYESPIGHKDSAYEDEEFMLNGYPEYTWEDLSLREKKFYNDYNDEKRKRGFYKSKRNCEIDTALERNILITDS